MWLIFHITFTWVGTPLSDQLDEFLGGTFTETVKSAMDNLGVVAFLQDLITDGVIAGVGGCISIRPSNYRTFLLYFFTRRFRLHGTYSYIDG